VAAGCRWAFTHLQMEVILWRAEIGNLPSRRVAEKVGFTIEATLRLRLRHRGTRVDAWVGSLLPGELSLRQ
jgi:RimJ/RimL family protein N-acetyltransferase